MYLRPSAPRSIGGVLDDGLRLWRVSISKTWILALLAHFVVAIPSVVLSIQSPSASVAPGKGGLAAANAANAQLMLELMKSPSMLLAYGVAILVSFALYAAFTLRIAGVANDEGLSLGSSVAAGFRLLPRMVLQMLLLILVLGGGGVIAVLFAGIVSSIGAPKALAGFLAVIAMVLIFGFLLGRIVVAFIALIVDDAGALGSIKESWALTRGNWWRCAAILVVLIFIAVVFTLVFAFTVGLIAVSLGPTSLAATVVTQLLSLILNAFIGSLYPAVLMAIFYDLKMRKQGADLLGRVETLAPQ